MKGCWGIIQHGIFILGRDKDLRAWIKKVLRQHPGWQLAKIIHSLQSLHFEYTVCLNNLCSKKNLLKPGEIILSTTKEDLKPRHSCVKDGTFSCQYQSEMSWQSWPLYQFNVSEHNHQQRPRVLYEVADLRYAIRSALSFFFLMPAKIIFVPGMYFLGFSK